MRKLMLVGWLVGLSLAVSAWASSDGLIEVHYYPAWIDHAENAGPLVAIRLGFYEEVGLQVTDLPGGPDFNPLDRLINDRGIAFATSYNWLVLVARTEQNLPFKVVATDFQEPALHLVSWQPITSKEDLFGKTVEVWTGYDYPLLAFLGEDQERVNILKQGGEMVPFLNRDRDAAHAMVYNELLIVVHEMGFASLEDYWRAEDKPFYVYRFGELDSDLAWDENSLVTTERTLIHYPEVVQAFVSATYRGWYWVMTHTPEEVFDILITFNDSLDKEHEMAGLIEILKLMIDQNTRAYGLGYLNWTTWEPMACRLYEAGLLPRMPSGDEIRAAYHWVPSGVFPPE